MWELDTSSYSFFTSEFLWLYCVYIGECLCLQKHILKCSGFLGNLISNLLSNSSRKKFLLLYLQLFCNFEIVSINSRKWKLTYNDKKYISGCLGMEVGWGGVERRDNKGAWGNSFWWWIMKKRDRGDVSQVIYMLKFINLYS